MEIINLQNDLDVFGIHVTSFPNGIDQAFDTLVKKVGGFDRPFYGISYMQDAKMVYLATALEKAAGEAEKLSYPRYTIEKGDYLAVTVNDWRKKTGSIKNIFEDMMRDGRFDWTKPAVEWYKNDEEMLCMLKVKKDG